jgi:hypothetical protein
MGFEAQKAIADGDMLRRNTLNITTERRKLTENLEASYEIGRKIQLEVADCLLGLARGPSYQDNL